MLNPIHVDPLKQLLADECPNEAANEASQEEHREAAQAVQNRYGYRLTGTSAGMRLSQTHRTTWPEDLLRDFAVQTLGVQRCSRQYLDALRYVLGNMAEADRLGSVLWMSRRSAERLKGVSDNTLRAIGTQLIKAGLCTLLPRRQGGFVSLTVAYRGASVRLKDAAKELERVERSQEEKDAAQMHYFPEAEDVGIKAEEVPY